MQTNNAKAMFPLSAALGLKFVASANNSEYPGFDEDDVNKALGTTRYNNLVAKVKRVFCCGHRSYPITAGPLKAGYEVHCFYADDLEAFLKGGG